MKGPKGRGMTGKGGGSGGGEGRHSLARRDTTAAASGPNWSYPALLTLTLLAVTPNPRLFCANNAQLE